MADNQMVGTDDKIVVLSNFRAYHAFVTDNIINPMVNRIGELETKVAALETTVSTLTGETASYSVIAILTNAELSNKATSVMEGEPYETVVSAKDGHHIASVVVVMGGEDITEACYSDGTVSIPAVTGAVSITARADANVYSVSYSLGNVTSSNSSAVATHGTQYFALLTPDTGYGEPDTTVLMGGEDVTDGCVYGNRVIISSVTGDVEIRSTAELKVFNVSFFTLNTESSNKSTTALYGSSYSTVLTPNDGFKLGSVAVTMGGVDVTGDYYSDGTVVIGSVTGDVRITASSVELGNYPVVNELVGMRNENASAQVKEGSRYEASIVALEDYAMGPVTVTMGGVDITESCYSDGEIAIANVTGAIVVGGSGVRITYPITLSLDGVDSSNQAETVLSGDDYETTLSCSVGHEIGAVLVTVGGTTIVNAYDPETGNVSLTCVRGAVGITASSTAITLSVTMDLTNAKSSNTKRSAQYGSSYSTTITCADDTFRMESVSVRMGGEDISGVYNEDTGKVTIPSVTGNVEITAVAVARTYYAITNELVGMTTSNSATSVEEGHPYTAELSVEDGYENPIVVVTMGGEVVQGAFEDGSVNIPSVTGDIVVIGNASEIPDIPVLQPDKTENGAEIIPDTYNIDTNPNQTTKAPFFIVVPAHDTTITTWSIAFGTKRTTSTSGNKTIKSICPPKVSEWDGDFSVEKQIATPFNTEMYGSATEGGAKGWFAGTETEADEGGMHSVWGEPIIVNGNTLYKYTSRLADGSQITLKAGVPYTFGIYTGIYLGENPADTNFAVFTRPDGMEGETRWLALGNNDYRTTSATYAGTAPMTDFQDGGNIPAIWFDGEIFTDFGSIAEEEPVPVPVPNDIEEAETINGSEMILARSESYRINNTNNTKVAPYYIVRPARDITVETWTVAVARPYLTSTSNDNRSICPPKVSLWDNTMNVETILSSNMTAMVYGRASEAATTYQWFDGRKGHTSASNGGIMKVYGEPINIDDTDMYKYKCKLADGQSLHLEAGKTYTFGIYAGVYNDDAGLQTSFPVFPTDEQHEWCALGNNNWTNADGSNNIVGITPISETITDGHLPVIWFNDELFTEFTDDKASDGDDSGTEYGEASTYTTQGLVRNDFNYAWEVKNRASSSDRVILVMRHSERGDDTSRTGGLTDRGKEFAALAGQALAESDTSNDKYGSTAVVRTMDTAYRIATGRGYTGLSSYNDVTTNEVDSRLNVLDGKYYTSDSNWDNVGRLYQSDPELVEEKFGVMVKTLCSASENSKLAVYITHDFVVVPSLCYMMDTTITSANWVNYMSGVGIIVHQDGTYEVYPIKMFDNGLGGGYTASGYDVVHNGMDAEIARISGGGGDTPSGGDTSSDTRTSWSEDFSDYDVTKPTNTVNNWYSFTNTDGILNVQLSEPDGDKSIGWFMVPIDGEPLDLTDGAYLSGTFTGTGNPVLAMRLVDSNGNRSGWVDIGNSGLCNGEDVGSIKNGTTLSSADISQWVNNSGFNRSSVIGLEWNMIAWSFNSPSYKGRTKSLTIDNLVLSATR